MAKQADIDELSVEIESLRKQLSKTTSALAGVLAALPEIKRLNSKPTDMIAKAAKNAETLLAMPN